MAKTKTSYRMLSPDGFDMYNGRIYFSEEKMEDDYKEWIKRFEHQGYYSSNNGQILLPDLRNQMIVEKTEYNCDELDAVAIIDMSNSSLTIIDVPTCMDSEETELYLDAQGFHLSNCSWGVFDGVIHDERDV